MKLIQIVTSAVISVVSTTTVLADAHDFTRVMDNHQLVTSNKTACETTFGHGGDKSQFHKSMLKSATNDRHYNSLGCQVNGLIYTASISGNLFDMKGYKTSSLAFSGSLASDMALLDQRTPMQASITGSVAQFARFTLIDESSARHSKTALQAAVTKQ